MELLPLPLHSTNRHGACAGCQKFPTLLLLPSSNVCPVVYIGEFVTASAAHLLTASAYLLPVQRHIENVSDHLQDLRTRQKALLGMMQDVQRNAELIHEFHKRSKQQAIAGLKAMQVGRTATAAACCVLCAACCVLRAACLHTPPWVRTRGLIVEIMPG